MPAPTGYSEVDSSAPAAPTLSFAPKGYTEVKPDSIPQLPESTGTGYPTIDSFFSKLTTKSPLNPHNWGDILHNVLHNAMGEKPTEEQLAQWEKDAKDPKYDMIRDTLLPAITPEGKTTGEKIGNAGGDLVNAALVALALHTASRVGGVKYNPTAADTAKDLMEVYKPSDPRFNERVPNAVADINHNAVDVNGNRVMITSNDHLASTSPTQVASQALDANRAVMDRWHNPVQAAGMMAQPDSILRATWNSLKDMADPQQKARVMQQVMQQIQQEPLNADRLRALLQEKNGELASFYDRDPSVQAAAKQAGALTGRSQALLEAQKKAIANEYYNLLDPQNEGAGPREIQRRYGAIKMLRDEASAGSTRNRILAETGGTDWGKVLRTGAGVVDAAVSPFKEGGLAEGLKNLKTIWTGESNPLIKRAFENAPEYSPLPEAPHINDRYPTLNGDRQLHSGPVVVEPGGGSPPVADSSFVKAVPAVYQPPNPARALPPATTRFQGDVSPGSGGGVEHGFSQQTGDQTKNLPTASDSSRIDTNATLHMDPTAVARDNIALSRMGRAYSRLSQSERLIVEKIRTGQKLTISDLSNMR